MKPMWDNLRRSNFNTVLGSVSWESIEPTEGEYNFTHLDEVIQDARRHGLHLVLLWFGSYKNGMSSYVPSWVKKDVVRFPRAIIHENGRPKMTNVVSPFSENACEADARAFAALMHHVRQVDHGHSTVLMVQIQNECGILGDSRDRSGLADAAFNQPMAADLAKHLLGKQRLHAEFDRKFPVFRQIMSLQEQKLLTWTQAFGDTSAADEMFMAFGYATYLGKVANAGKKEYPLPMFTNVWLNTDDQSLLDMEGMAQCTSFAAIVGGGTKPGEYPSGGPCPHTLDLYKYFAPALDFISPDIYLQNYVWACEQYTHDNQPLFIPEQRADAWGARRTWSAYGSFGAIGCSPFGVDGTTPADSAFTKPYGLLARMSPHILAAQASRSQDMMGFFFDPPAGESSMTLDKQAPGESWTRDMGGFRVRIERSFSFGKPTPGYGMVLHHGDGRFLLIGEGFEASFSSAQEEHSSHSYTGILEMTEMIVGGDGSLSRGRRLNGDERRGGDVAVMPAEDIDLGGFPIWVFVPARTMIAEVIVYSVGGSS